MIYPLTLCAMNVPDVGFEERVRVASAAGFRSIGLTITQYRRAHDEGLDDQTMRDLLHRFEITVDEVEGPWDWLSGDAQSVEDTETAFRVVRELDCGQVTAVQFWPGEPEQRVLALQSLCDAAAGYGARVAVEFMPFSRIPSLADAWTLVRSAERDNCGLVLDAWHFARTEGWEGTLGSIPPERFFAVQLCDAAPVAESDLREEARHRRLPPGAGSTAFLTLLGRLGFAGRLSTEVWSDELLSHGPEATARALYAAADASLSAAGWPRS